jgi:hypothetical protein
MDQQASAENAVNEARELRELEKRALMMRNLAINLEYVNLIVSEVNEKRENRSKNGQNQNGQ